MTSQELFLAALISLTTLDNDYQQEQAAAAEGAARRLNVNVRIAHVDKTPSNRASNCNINLASVAS
jgi:hypothetical protein